MSGDGGLLTPEEAIKALCLDKVKKHPRASLYYLVRTRQTCRTKIAGTLMSKLESAQNLLCLSGVMVCR